MIVEMPPRTPLFAARKWTRRVQFEWYWHVSRRFGASAIRFWIASHIPRSIALLVYVRVVAYGDPDLKHAEAYEQIYKAWRERPQ